MKTPDEYLDEFSTDTTTKGRVKAIDAIAAIRAAVKDACREQREICYTEARIDRDLGGDIYIIEDSIKNAPEPTLS